MKKIKIISNTREKEAEKLRELVIKLRQDPEARRQVRKLLQQAN